MRSPLNLLLLALTASTLGLCGGAATAQCQTAYSPVLAPAPAAAYQQVAYSPVVYQTTTANPGWYPGKYLANFTRSVFGWPRTTTTVTAGYAPAYAAPAYTTGYSPYTASYAPAYTAGYAPAYQTAYRPTYPATYGPVVQSVSRPVVLSAVAAQPDCGVTQSVYDAPLAGACSSCGPSAAVYASPADGGSTYYPEPRPALGEFENPPAERSLIEAQKPEEASLEGDRNQTEASDAAASSEFYWRAPPLFAPSNRVTQRATHPAPVRTAVYRQPVEATRTSFETDRPRRTAPSGVVHRLGAEGWSSAER